MDTNDGNWHSYFGWGGRGTLRTQALPGIAGNPLRVNDGSVLPIKVTRTKRGKPPSRAGWVGLSCWRLSKLCGGHQGHQRCGQQAL
jgi:hypothetical protein